MGKNQNIKGTIRTKTMNQYMHLIEEISLNAWPSQKVELYDGWLIRFSYNYTHRTNCVNLVAPSTLPLEEKIAFCENEYRNAHTPSIFKISPFETKDFDSLLAGNGYEIQHTTDVLTMPLTDFHPYPSVGAEYEFYQRNSGLPSFVTYPGNVLVQLSDTITDDWITNLFRLNGTTNPTHRRIVPSMYKAIPKQTIAAWIEIDGRTVASGLGILDRDHVGLYAIYVDASCRRNHFGHAICSTIISEAMKLGSTHAYLQVVAGNNGARKLYEMLGFHYLYTYWFRVKNQKGRLP
jgi:ribosomal protein S18 acetylase RimI-like enzyme